MIFFVQTFCLLNDFFSCSDFCLLNDFFSCPDFYGGRSLRSLSLCVLFYTVIFFHSHTFLIRRYSLLSIVHLLNVNDKDWQQGNFINGVTPKVRFWAASDRGGWVCMEKL
jgi:hypothetical protein